MSRTLKMLLIDDEPGVVRPLSVVIGRAFERRVDLTALTDSVAAKSWVDRHAPELVVTDLQMPEVSGFDILKSAKRQNPDCQVIVWSAYLSADTTRLARRLGATTCLAKSADRKCLLDALELAYRHVVEQAEEPTGGEPIESLPGTPVLSGP